LDKTIGLMGTLIALLAAIGALTVVTFAVVIGERVINFEQKDEIVNVDCK